MDINAVALWIILEMELNVILSGPVKERLHPGLGNQERVNQERVNQILNLAQWIRHLRVNQLPNQGSEVLSSRGTTPNGTGYFYLLINPFTEPVTNDMLTFLFMQKFSTEVWPCTSFVYISY